MEIKPSEFSISSRLHVDVAMLNQTLQAARSVPNINLAWLCLQVTLLYIENTLSSPKYVSKAYDQTAYFIVYFASLQHSECGSVGQSLPGRDGDNIARKKIKIFIGKHAPNVKQLSS